MTSISQKDNILPSRKGIAFAIACLSILASFCYWSFALSNYISASILSAESAYGPVLPIKDAANDPVLIDRGTDTDNTNVPEELLQWKMQNLATVLIPKISVRAPVYVPDAKFWSNKQWGLVEEQMQLGLYYGLAAYPHSAAPGENGTLLIAGHSSPPNSIVEQSDYGEVFARLPELQEDDVITVIKQDGGFVDYAVRSMKIVSADDTAILKQQNKASLLTLITCFPIGTTKDRLVITAERIDEGGRAT